jgi:hypothetical protein
MATNVSKLGMSKHAADRCQQRAIPPLIVDWLVQFGAETYDGHGATIRHFDRASLRRLASHVGPRIVSLLSALLSAYLVICDGTVVTAGYRYKRIRKS